MDFANKAHEEIYKKVADWMKELFGMFVQPMPDAPVFVLAQGDTLVQIAVIPWADDDATVSIRSYVVSDAEMTSDFMHYLLRENESFRFGAFAIDSEDDVFFEHTIVGSTLDPEELKASVFAVTGTSDRYADEIIPRFGGTKFVDKMRDQLKV